MGNPICPYCSKEAKLVGGDYVYPHRKDLTPIKFWICIACDAWTGTHKSSPIHAPKGRLAKADLRAAKIAAHKAFDPIWQNGSMNRRQAYRWLQEQLGAERQPHIGWMDIEECQEVRRICLEKIT